MVTKHNKHLFILAGLLLFGAVGAGAARTALVPRSWGEKGAYRADHTAEEASRPAHLVTRNECFECHPKVEETFADSVHKTVACFSCHGAARVHRDACRDEAAKVKAGEVITKEASRCNKVLPDQSDFRKDRTAANCINCHGKKLGPPSSHKQIVVARHLKKFDATNPDAYDVCKECHMSHNPAETPPEPEEVAPEQPSDHAPEKAGEGGTAEPG